jgi:hypothetical protein
MRIMCGMGFAGAHIIESPVPLAAMFPDDFTLLHPRTAAWLDDDEDEVSGASHCMSTT